jgi:hypothetical protein
MNKTILTIGSLLFFVTCLKAQKSKDETLDFLKGETQLNIIIDYTAVKIGNNNEKDFVEIQCIKGGETWKDKWNGRIKKDYLRKFIGSFNINFIGKTEFRAGEFPTATFQATLKGMIIDQNGNMTGDVFFSKLNSDITLASVNIKADGGHIGSITNLIGDGFAKAGASLGKYVSKKIK